MTLQFFWYISCVRMLSLEMLTHGSFYTLVMWLHLKVYIELSFVTVHIATLYSLWHSLQLNNLIDISLLGGLWLFYLHCLFLHSISCMSVGWSDWLGETCAHFRLQIWQSPLNSGPLELTLSNMSRHNTYAPLRHLLYQQFEFICIFCIQALMPSMSASPRKCCPHHSP